jgi:hypothetical protein
MFSASEKVLEQRTEVLARRYIHYAIFIYSAILNLLTLTEYTFSFISIIADSFVCTVIFMLFRIINMLRGCLVSFDMYCGSHSQTVYCYPET